LTLRRAGKEDGLSGLPGKTCLKKRKRIFGEGRKGLLKKPAHDRVRKKEKEMGKRG